MDCGKEISHGATRCEECNRIYLKEIANQKSKIPTREELKKMIRTMSFVEIAKKYGVSDSAVRKWCDKLNLPRLKKDINQMTEKEWKSV